jgi:hypothetical protein
MSPESGQAWFRLGFFLTLMSLVLMPFLPSDSAEFVVDVLALVVGLIILTLVVVIVKLSNR